MIGERAAMFIEGRPYSFSTLDSEQTNRGAGGSFGTRSNKMDVRTANGAGQSSLPKCLTKRYVSPTDQSYLVLN